MKQFLRKGSFLAFAVAFTGTLCAAPPGHPAGIKKAWTLQDFWVEDFSLPNGTVSDTGSSAWTASVSYSKAVFAVSGNAFKVNNVSVNGVGVWVSAPISIAGKTGIRLSADVRSAVDGNGSLENDGTPHADYIRLYYKVDGGAEILFGDLGGNINNNSSTPTNVYTTSAISGSTVQIIIRAKATATDEYYYFDNVTVSGNGGCTDADVPAGVSAFSSDQITCYNTSVELTGASSTPGVSYHWSGPGGFSANTAITQAGAGGNYLLTVTNPANGCSKTVTAVVVQNTAPPANVNAANAGPLTCTITEVSITASSSDANVDYVWTGPDGYLSFSAEDVVSQPGDYVLTATNLDNGCAVTDTTTVLLNCSGERRITTADPTGAHAMAGDFQWKAWPNPSKGKAFISFKSPAAGFVSIHVYGSNGMAEKQLFNNKATANQNYQLTLDGLPAGMHYLVLRINNKVYTGTLVSVK